MPPASRFVTANPAKGGAKAIFCYDFTTVPEVTSAITIDVNFTPSSGSQSFILTPATPCAEVDVPASAVGMTLHDTSGHSTDLSVPVVT